jgi:hypothetical protein
MSIDEPKIKELDITTEEGQKVFGLTSDVLAVGINVAANLIGAKKLTILMLFLDYIIAAIRNLDAPLCHRYLLVTHDLLVKGEEHIAGSPKNKERQAIAKELMAKYCQVESLRNTPPEGRA